ncbi:MAG: hypothetical protein FWF59_05325 [Turicibacter sp.]|nr:hypothetical protein [Turicibacter sp.]
MLEMSVTIKGNALLIKKVIEFAEQEKNAQKDVKRRMREAELKGADFGGMSLEEILEVL